MDELDSEHLRETCFLLKLKCLTVKFECKGVAPIPCHLIASLGVSENGIKWVYIHRIAILGRKMMIDTDRTLVFWDPMFSLELIVHFGGAEN